MNRISITLNIFQLRKIMTEAAMLGAKQAMVELGSISPFQTQSESYRMYGRKTVEKLISDGLIIAHKSGEKNSRVLLDRLQLSVLVKSEELIVDFKEAA